jgi:protein gp37
LTTNRTRIEWTDFTWNPITGCNRECSYCYARQIAENILRGRYGYDKDNPFKPTFHPNKLKEPLEHKKSCLIFTCSMGDFFDPAVPEEWRDAVFGVMDETPRHIYQILTKQVPIEPKFRDTFPQNLWLGVTVDGTSDYWEKPLQALKHSSACIKFISFEPVLGNDIPDDLSDINWCILGAQSGTGARPVNQDYVLKIMNLVDHYKIPVFIKDNLRAQLGALDRREFPKTENGGLDDWL